MNARALLRIAAGLLGIVCCLAAAVAQSGGGRRLIGPNAKHWTGTVDKAIQYLKSSQAQDGSWSREKSPGVTGIVLSGLLSTGRVGSEDPVAEHALQYIESLINPKAHHIAGKDPAVQLQNYVTSVNVMALKAANR